MPVVSGYAMMRHVFVDAVVHWIEWWWQQKHLEHPWPWCGRDLIWTEHAWTFGALLSFFVAPTGHSCTVSSTGTWFDLQRHVLFFGSAMPPSFSDRHEIEWRLSCSTKARCGLFALNQVGVECDEQCIWIGLSIVSCPPVPKNLFFCLLNHRYRSGHLNLSLIKIDRTTLSNDTHEKRGRSVQWVGLAHLPCCPTRCERFWFLPGRIDRVGGKGDPLLLKTKKSRFRRPRKSLVAEWNCLLVEVLDVFGLQGIVGRGSFLHSCESTQLGNVRRDRFQL